MTEVGETRRGIMLSDINTDKVTNKAGEKAYWECKDARTKYYKYMGSKREVFLINSLERPVV